MLAKVPLHVTPATLQFQPLYLGEIEDEDTRVAASGPLEHLGMAERTN